MKIHDCIQGSEEWQRIRRGRPTASKFRDIITAAKGQLSKAATGYMNELIAEVFCPEWDKFAGNIWTDRGIALEPEARDAFRDVTKLEVEEVGFVTRADEVVGCSPDGLIRERNRWTAGLEIKCPAPDTHVSYVAAGNLPGYYKQQVHGGMAVTGLDTWYFMSYCPGMAPLILRIERDSYTALLARALDQFLLDYATYRERMIPLLQTKAATVRQERDKTQPF